MSFSVVTNKEILYALQERGCPIINAFEEIRFAQEGNYVHTDDYDMEFDPIEKEFTIHDHSRPYAERRREEDEGTR